ncbi:MAG: hypothetical protein OEW35_10215 [Gammaproteobacteria bacterium]|nr:hypothetical protein [Gammaproteobacteria bacterium]MDH4255581.1 hypothetical protein [Gammaproteobacteria bacterium]MDH5311572.1 hypothetical protein [Gammaproteobacteria bacterium]
MSVEIACYRCGESLAALSLPLSRRDLCPACSASLHACRMCRHFDPSVPRQCREDGAEEVTNKENANFCDWFEPVGGRFDSSGASKAVRARDQLAVLFGDAEAPEEKPDAALSEAEKLFR